MTEETERVIKMSQGACIGTRMGAGLKITFVSNYINHHQIPFCEALYRELGQNFAFIQTEPMEEERVRMGWALDAGKISYVHLYYEEEKLCRELIDGCDFLLAGWTEREELLTPRLNSGRPAARISERIYREGQWKAVSPRGLVHKYQEHIRYRRKPVYLLCAGAYVASDYKLIGAYPEKKYRFGYFPETRRYSDAEFDRLKPSEGPVQLVWAARMIPLKHPEFAVRLAEELKREGVPFMLHMVGSGEMEEDIRRQIAEKSLENCIRMYGFTPPSRVRDIMEGCHIHLFTSNHLEGWGAVVGEAMNSGCAVVGSAQAGAVPFLIKDGVNGMIYRNGDYGEYAAKVKELIKDTGRMRQMGRFAYETIRDVWNAENAANRCIRFYEELEAGGIVAPEDGPFSIAPVLWP